MKYLIVLVLLLSGCASMGNHADDLGRAIDADHRAGRIGELEYSQKSLAHAQQYQPEAYVLHGVLQDRVALASALERGDITRLDFDLAWNKRKTEFLANRQQAQNQPMNPVQAILMMNMINNSANRIGNSMQPNNLQFPTRCHSSAYGNGIDTTCY